MNKLPFCFASSATSFRQQAIFGDLIEIRGFNDSAAVNIETRKRGRGWLARSACGNLLALRLLSLLASGSITC
jgi:hypothetical protein